MIVMKLALALFILLVGVGVMASETCCQKAGRLAKLRYIPDPDAVAPEADAEGRPRMIPRDDGSEAKEETEMIPNPNFEWSAPLVPNPKYMPPTLQDEVQKEVMGALPWIVLGTLVTALLETLQLPVRCLGDFLSRTGPLGGAVIGLATPLCSCGALPVAAGFIRSGVSLPTVVAFLVASQSAGLDSFAITWGLLGPIAALWRLGGAFFLAVLAGGVLPAVLGTATASVEDSSTKEPEHGLPDTSFVGKVMRALDTFPKAAASTAADTFPPVLAGLILSAVVGWAAPAIPSAPHEFSGADGLLARVVVMAAALPLQLCEHSTVTAAAAIQKGGGSAGLAFAFLLAAPAINLPGLLLLVSSDEKSNVKNNSRSVVICVSFALTAGAVLLSYVVDGLGLDLLVTREASLGGSQMISLPPLFVTSSPWIAGLLVFGVAQKKSKGAATTPSGCQEKKDTAATSTQVRTRSGNKRKKKTE